MDMFKDFTELKAVQKLEQLAEKPYNLADPASLPPERMPITEPQTVVLIFSTAPNGLMIK
jgi:hypothetical protein